MGIERGGGGRGEGGGGGSIPKETGYSERAGIYSALAIERCDDLLSFGL